MKLETMLVGGCLVAVTCLIPRVTQAQEAPEVSAVAETTAEVPAEVPAAEETLEATGESTEVAEIDPDDALFDDSGDDDGWGDMEEDEDEVDLFALQIFGFASVSFQAPLWSDSDPWSNLLGRDSSNFYIGDTNIYISKPMSQSLRSMIEIRLLFSPNGEVEPAQDTNYTDQNTLEDRRWGGINIERVYVEKDFHKRFSLRVGKFLTPYGIWNVDHGAPAIITVRRPYMVGQGLFPESQTGLMAHGEFPGATYTWGYNLTISNGRGRFEESTDFNEFKALGGRFHIRGTHGRLRWKAGLSAMADKFTDRDGIALTPMLESKANHLEVGNDISLGVDLSVDYKGLAFRSEGAYHERNYDEETRPVRGTGLAPDFFRNGIYAMAGYRIADLKLMPFGLYQYFRFGDSDALNDLHALSAGLNYRPSPDLVIKAEYVWADIDTNLSYEFGSYSLAQTQVSWIF